MNETLKHFTRLKPSKNHKNIDSDRIDERRCNFDDNKALLLSTMDKADKAFDELLKAIRKDIK